MACRPGMDGPVGRARQGTGRIVEAGRCGVGGRPGPGRDGSSAGPGAVWPGAVCRPGREGSECRLARPGTDRRRGMVRRGLAGGVAKGRGHRAPGPAGLTAG